MGLRATAWTGAGVPLLTILAHCTYTQVCGSNPILNAPGKFDNEKNLFLSSFILRDTERETDRHKQALHCQRGWSLKPGLNS